MLSADAIKTLRALTIHVDFVNKCTTTNQQPTAMNKTESNSDSAANSLPTAPDTSTEYGQSSEP